ncbi:MAG: STAS domain-containing protein [Clostridia bacterium]|nr:STAS domain-containing protein [Clostridia bacterium]
MLNIQKKAEGQALAVSLEGRLDTTTAPALQDELSNLDGISLLTLDMEKLEYISSAGLRVLLSTEKRMKAQGEMKVTHVNETVMEIFEVTGFSEILTIE